MRRGFLLSIVVVAAAVLAAPASAGECDSTAMSSEGDQCCFTNPRFTGVCTVTPGSDETCSDILAYLNNQASTGKAYCGNTPIRGGWAQVDCEQKSAGRTEAPREPPRSE